MDRVQSLLDGLTGAGQLGGVAALAWSGDAPRIWCSGWRDAGAAAPITPNALFRIASLSKPITCVAALMLYDEGRFALEDPITTWAPEFASMQVLRDPEGPLDDTIPATRPITFADLMTHRAGFTYGDFHRGPVSAAYAQALGGDIDTDLTPEEWIARLAALPLIDQPGTGFHYSHAIDLLGLLIARMEGEPLGQVLARRIFGPLGMVDTSFNVPPEKQGRRAVMYAFDAEDRLAPRAEGISGAFRTERPADMSFESGGQGLWSTLSDYLAFARLFVGDGAVDGVRLLKVGTLRRMTADWLTPEQRASATLLGMPVFVGHGLGLGVYVVTDPEKAQVIRGKGGAGTVGWPGAYGSWWQADPTDGSVMILLTHNMVEFAQMRRGIGLGAYAAATGFHAAVKGEPSPVRT